jgi:UrcA family protein
MFKSITAAALAAATIATPALAERDTEVSVATVRYSDLDLSTERGLNTLQNRLENAAREVCGMNERFSGSQIPAGESRKCYVDTLKSFEREIANVAERQERRAHG